MKKAIGVVLLIIITIGANQGLATEDKNTLAILDFSNNSIVDREKYASLSQGLAEIMITELSKIQSLELLERQKINSLIEEMKLSQSGIISEAAGIQVGKLLGAHFLVFGGYMVSFNDQIRVDIRIVEVETGLTIKAEEVTDKISSIFKIIKKINEKITQDLNLKLTKQERQLLDKTDISMDVISYFSRGLAYEKDKNLAEAKKMYRKTLEKDPAFAPAKKRLEELSDGN